MSDILKDKIKEIEGYLSELEEIIPQNLERYLQNFEKRAACEHYFEKITEAIIDLVFIFINERRIEMPEDDESALEILVKEKVISLDLGRKLQEARRMRNIIAHKYGNVNHELIFNAISEELIKDVREFLKNIRKNL